MKHRPRHPSLVDLLRITTTVVSQRLPEVQNLECQYAQDMAARAWIITIDGEYLGVWFVATEKVENRDIMLANGHEATVNLFRDAFVKAADTFITGIKALPQSDTPQIVEEP